MQAFIPSAPTLSLSPSRSLLSSFKTCTTFSPQAPARRRRPLTMTASAPPPLEDGMILFAKAGPGGKVMGDCPFTWKANLALRFKNTDFNTFYIDLANKPGWFLDLNENGSTPTFVDGPHAIGDSDEIVDYADKVGRKENLILTREDDPNWDAAFDAVSPVFGSFIRFVKNKEPDNEPKVKAELTEALRGVNKFLAQGKGPFLLGETISALDCNLAPKLQHISVAAGHYKGYRIPPDCSDLQAFLERMRATEEWKASACTDDVIVWGWSKFF